MVMTASAATISGSASQVSLGSTPVASRKTNTAIRLRQRLKRPVSTTESGITRRGNCILRTMFSLFTTERTARVVAFGEEREERQVEKQELGVVGDVRTG